MASSAIAIIPARYASSRFPGKVLVPLVGRPMLAHVVAGVREARRVDRVIVATDDERVADAAREAGAEAVMTRSDHASGTDRVAEAVRDVPGGEVVVNIQADEPLISGESVDRLAGALLDDPSLGMATLCEPLDDEDSLFDPNVVKVVTDRKGRALYFSRAPLPFHWPEGRPLEADLRKVLSAGPIRGFLRHVGIYGYRREILLSLAESAPTPLEAAERLEQLRALETGVPIRVLPAAHRSVEVNRPEDLSRVEAVLRESTRC